MMPLDQEMKLLYQELFTQFSADSITQLAMETGFIRRKRKLTAMDSLFLFVFTTAHLSDSSLEDLCTYLQDQTGKVLSAEGLNQRFNWRTIVFLQAIFERLLQTKLLHSFQKLMKYSAIFEKIRVLDSTAFQIPDAFAKWFPGTGCTSVKFQIEFELLSGQFTHAHFEPGRIHDAKTGNSLCQTVQSKELILRDLGYLNLAEYEKLTKQTQRYFISRLRNNALVYQKNPFPSYCLNGKLKVSTVYTQHAIQELANTVKRGETKEFEGFYVGKNKVKMPIRLVICHFSVAQQEKRIARMKEIERVRGIRYQEKTKAMSAYGIYMTNLPEAIAKEDIYQIYSLRWQIELLFKVWKSTMALPHCKPMKIERFICYFYSQLIRLLLCTMVTYQMRYLLWVKSRKELSEMKGIEMLFDKLEALYLAIKEGAASVVQTLLYIFSQMERHGLKSRKKGKPTFQQLIGTLE
ncbi:IS4 family transposase [Metasolibacillus sp. FSL H7-0170]|uniref:IS4 family transposase n=2 Tax=unclassified Metasolibacillus TaxID=2703679 RepID=UPI003158BB2A